MKSSAPLPAPPGSSPAGPSVNSAFSFRFVFDTETANIVPAEEPGRRGEGNRSLLPHRFELFPARGERADLLAGRFDIALERADVGVRPLVGGRVGELLLE